MSLLLLLGSSASPPPSGTGLLWGSGNSLTWGGTVLDWNTVVSPSGGNLEWGAGNTLFWGTTELAWGDGTVVEPPVVTPPAVVPGPVASGGGRGTVATYDNDWSSFRSEKKRKRKKADTDGPPVTDPAPMLQQGPPRSTKAIVQALLREASQTEGPKPLELKRKPDDDDDEEILELLLSAL